MADVQVEDVIRKLKDGMQRLHDVAKADPPALSNSYAPGRWNGKEIIAHLADCEAVFYYRFLKTIAEEGSPVVPFDQDRWAKELNYNNRRTFQAQMVVNALHIALMELLCDLPSEKLQRKTFHPERGEMTALQIANLAADHMLHHLEQLEAIIEGREWESENR